MKIKSMKLEGNKGVLELENADVYFVNALRRVMLSELPKLAIDDVIIYDNTSPLFDEIISHRLSLIPIPTDLRLLTFKDECKCDGKGCPSCTVRYTLSKEGEGPVLSGDLQPETKDWEIKEDKIPIVELTNDQRIILEVEAILGRGKDHAKWQCVQSPRYIMEPIIEFDKKRINEVKDLISELPEGIVDFKKDQIIIKDRSRLPILEMKIDKTKADYIKVKKDFNKISFYFETDGSLDAKDALKESIKLISEKYEEFSKLVSKIK